MNQAGRRSRRLSSSARSTQPVASWLVELYSLLKTEMNTFVCNVLQKKEKNTVLVVPFVVAVMIFEMRGVAML